MFTSKLLRVLPGVAFFLSRCLAQQCYPALFYAASLVISAAGTAASIEGQKQQAEAQAETQTNLVKASNTVAAEQAAQLRANEAQTQEATARDNEKARQASQRTKATTITAAGEAGASGASIDALLQEHAMQYGLYREAANRQAQLHSQGIDAQIEAVRTGGRYQNLQINAPIVGPNYAAAFADFGRDVTGASADYFRPSSPRK